MLRADNQPIHEHQLHVLDPSIVSASIPAFYIARNKEGFWVAREVKRRVGGIFLLKTSALSFAKKCGGKAGCATIFLSEPLELDLKNKGNPFIAQLGSLKRFASRLHLRR